MRERIAGLAHLVGGGLDGLGVLGDAAFDERESREGRRADVEMVPCAVGTLHPLEGRDAARDSGIDRLAIDRPRGNRTQ